MKRRLLKFLLPMGLFVEFIYIVVNRFIVKIPDIAAYPMLSISIVLMLAGIVYNVSCLKKKKSS